MTLVRMAPLTGGNWYLYPGWLGCPVYLGEKFLPIPGRSEKRAGQTPYQESLGHGAPVAKARQTPVNPYGAGPHPSQFLD